MRTGPARRLSANYLAFGYTALQNGQIVLSRLAVRRAAIESSPSAQVLGKRYFGTVDEAGARKVAHEFAADILAKFGGESLLGTQIYFVSDRTGAKEIWSMDPDGANQKQITRFNQFSIKPAVSPDGTKLRSLALPRAILVYLCSRWIPVGICRSIIRSRR